MEYDKLVSIVSEAIKVDSKLISTETRFVEDLGADSLTILQMLMNIEEAFDIDIADDVVANIKTVGDALERIQQAIS